VSTFARNAQRGTALVVSLIMLVLVTLLVLTAFNLASSTFRSVSNTQFRDEAVASANLAIQTVLGTPFTDAPAEEQVAVDLDRDGVEDYLVDIAQPACISADVASIADPSSLQLDPSLTAATTWNTVWDLNALVAPENNAGEASVRVHAGVRVLLSQAQKDTVCD
jgi:Tfp pilus assembly protein PilV